MPPPPSSPACGLRSVPPFVCGGGGEAGGGIPSSFDQHPGSQIHSIRFDSFRGTNHQSSQIPPSLPRFCEGISYLVVPPPSSIPPPSFIIVILMEHIPSD